MSTNTRITAFEVIDHGIENSQYFQGCGVAYTRYDYVTTGCGSDFSEAIEDALESIAQQHNGIDFPAFEQAIKDNLGVKTVSWPESAMVPADADDSHYYVSIRYSVEEEG